MSSSSVPVHPASPPPVGPISLRAATWPARDSSTSTGPFGSGAKPPQPSWRSEGRRRLLVEGINHRVGGALEVVPECLALQGRQVGEVDRDAHVAEPAVPGVGVDLEGLVALAQARVAAL